MQAKTASGNSTLSYPFLFIYLLTKTFINVNSGFFGPAVATVHTSGSQPGVRENFHGVHKNRVFCDIERFLLIKTIKGYLSFYFYVWGYVITKRLGTTGRHF